MELTRFRGQLVVFRRNVSQSVIILYILVLRRAQSLYGTAGIQPCLRSQSVTVSGSEVPTTDVSGWAAGLPYARASADEPTSKSCPPGTSRPAPAWPRSPTTQHSTCRYPL